jgi:cob(I)alamin adenosyltransferase
MPGPSQQGTDGNSIAQYVNRLAQSVFVARNYFDDNERVDVSDYIGEPRR